MKPKTLGEMLAEEPMGAIVEAADRALRSLGCGLSLDELHNVSEAIICEWLETCRITDATPLMIEGIGRVEVLDPTDEAVVCLAPLVYEKGGSAERLEGRTVALLADSS